MTTRAVLERAREVRPAIIEFSASHVGKELIASVIRITTATTNCDLFRGVEINFSLD